MGKPPTHLSYADRLGVRFQEVLPRFFRNEPGLEKISFKMGPYVFDRKTWRKEIPDRIANGRIKTILSHKMKAGAEAEYHPGDKALVFKREFSLYNNWEKQVAVHECAHMWVDDGPVKGAQSSWLDEMAAYTAGVCYAVLKGERVGSAIRQAALPVANKILAHPGVYLVTLKDGRPIREALSRNNLYKKPEIWTEH